MKCRTFICDIDGVIFEHLGTDCIEQWGSLPKILPGVFDQFVRWEAESAVIVLMTARPECLRDQLECELKSQGLFWDHLIMGVGHGQRVLINDKKPTATIPSAVAVELPRNQGLRLR